LLDGTEKFYRDIDKAKTNGPAPYCSHNDIFKH